MLYNGNFLEVTVSVSWRLATAAFCTQIGFTGTSSRCFPKEPTFSTRVTLLWLGKITATTIVDGEYLVLSSDDPGSIKLPLSPALYTTSTGGVRGSGCLQVHLTSAFSRRVQRKVNESRGAAVDS